MPRVVSISSFGEGFIEHGQAADGIVWEPDDISLQEINCRPKRKKHYEVYSPVINPNPIDGGVDITFED